MNKIAILVIIHLFTEFMHLQIINRLYELNQISLSRLISVDPCTTTQLYLLSVAYKNTIVPRTTAWRALISLEATRPRLRENSINISMKCLILLANNSFLNQFKAEAYVFYHYIKGVYFRYNSEYTSGAIFE